jgi:hypothetical protein
MRRVFPFAAVAALVAAGPLFAATPALDEVNAARASRGLPPFLEDPALTQAAMSAADYRAAYRIEGHVPGGQGDFGFLPPGTSASSAGCAAWPAHLGWGACCTYEGWRYGGAAVAIGADGRRYMHLFVSNRANAVAAPLCVCGDACSCDAGNCPAKCPTSQVLADAPDAYADVYAKVAKGQTVYVAVGVPAGNGAVRVAMAGVAPGLYRCAKSAKGEHLVYPGSFVRTCHGTYCTTSWQDAGQASR